MPKRRVSTKKPIKKTARIIRESRNQANGLYLFILMVTFILSSTFVFCFFVIPNLPALEKKGIDVSLAVEPDGFLKITEPQNGVGTTSADSFTIKGNSSEDCDAIKVVFSNEESGMVGDNLLPTFVFGQVNWQYQISSEAGNMAPGMNKYEFSLYKDEVVVALENAFVYYQKPAEETPVVEWFGELKKASGTNLVFDNDAYGTSGDIYEAGVIKSGRYEGAKVFLFSEHDLGMVVYYVIEINGEVWRPATLGLTIDEKAKLPQEIVFKPGDYVLKRGDYVSGIIEKTTEDKKVYGDEASGELYLKDGCVVAYLPDHSFVAYNFDFPFLRDLLIIFVDGKKNEDAYTYIRPTCGGICTYYNSADVNEALLKESGRIGKEVFYEFKNEKTKELQSLYDDKFTQAYYDEGVTLEESKYTYEEFLATHPILFWKDPLGRWVEFINGKFGTMAEMCKPVIYLYPQKETRTTVKVMPNGGITFSEPSYNGSWDVWARPSGKLTVDGQDYDYLFWEGVGKNMAWPDEGFVVKSSGLKKFFNDSLKKLSLSDKEIADFNEYWVDRLQGGEYWQISFIDEKDFDVVAPLSIDPQPDTVIRVMIYAKPLSSPVSIKEQVLQGKERKGFTVVEWGGAVFDK